MAGNNARKNRARNARRRENMGLPITRMRAPRDPPPFNPIPQWGRRIQLEYSTPTTGNKISPKCSDFFLALYATDQFNVCIIRSIRVWSTAKEDKPTHLTVSAGSPMSNTVPILTIEDRGKTGESARAGYRLLGAYRVPWAKIATFCNVTCDSYPVLIEMDAIFL
jgi:hypothetical protein